MWGSSAMNYARSAGGAISSGYGKGVSKLGATGMAAAAGGIGGGVYGATAGRDYGQSRFGGFMSGAAGGAALGAAGHRYGGAGLRRSKLGGSSRPFSGYAPGGSAAYGPMTRGGNAKARMAMGGRGAYRMMKRDALAAKRYIGTGLNGNGAINKLRGLGW